MAPLSMSALMVKRVRSEVLAGLALITAGLAAGPAGVSAQQTGQAQGQVAQQPTAAAAGQGAGELERITVTGYVVPRVGEGAQPVTTLDRDFIQQQANQTVSDVLQRLPSNSQGFTPFVNAGASFSPAASEVNLYGIGTGSTLVLIDNKRQAIFPFPQNGFQGFVDLNSIPLAAVDRIEVLKDGASALYGSDAIAGVVNILLKNDYNGGDIYGYWGISQRGDYEVYHAQATAGIVKQFSENSKFTLLAAFDYYQSSPIDASDRGFSADVNHSKRGADLSDLRSGTTPAGKFVGVTTGDVFNVTPGTSTLVPDGPTEFFNTVPGAQLSPREERVGAFVKMTYQLNQYVKLYDSFSYQYNHEKASFTASPVSNTDFIVTPATNPFNPTGQDLATRLRLLQAGHRLTETFIENYRNLGGIQLINLPKNWAVDASAVYAEIDGHQQGTNFVSKSGLQAALDGTLPGFEGVFFNPFIDQTISNAQNQKLINAAKIQTNDHARTSLVQLSLTAGGELFDLPAGPVTAGLGLEYRSNDFIDYKDKNSRRGNVVASGGGGNASGSDYVKAAYGELTIPILGGKWSWPGARLLEFVLSERYDDYSSFGEAWKPKFSIRYKPFDDLTLRASYSEGFRAPSVTELFSAPIQAFTFVTDPKIPPPPNGNFYEVALRTVGNPNLKPETAYSYYLGAVWTPGSHDPDHSWWGWANGFTAYVDWVEISKRNVINTINPQFVVNNPALFPGFVTRDPFGNILQVDDPLENLGAVRVDALDFGASYTTKEYSWGKLNLAVDATWNYHVSQQNTAGGQVINVTNSLAPSFPVAPDFKLTGSIFYSKTVFGVDTFRTGLTINYLDSEHDVNDFQGLGLDLRDPNFGFPDTHVVGSWTTFDWQISYTFGKPEEVTPVAAKPGYDKEGKRIVGEKTISPQPEGRSAGWRRWLAATTFTFGINDIFDTRPPFQDSTAGFDTASATPIQRYFYISVEKKF
jgi:iron complex outermembrane receptor protein